MPSATSPDFKNPLLKRAKWYEIIAEYQNSKESQVAYCKQNNLNKDHFAYYLSRWRKDKVRQESTKPFIPVQVVNNVLDKWVLKLSQELSLEVPTNICIEQLGALLLLLRDKHAN